MRLIKTILLKRKLKNTKIIFIDIDGTLTNSKKEVTEKTAKAIKRVVNKGIKVIITSGRNSAYCKDVSEKAGATPIVISSNGTSIFDYENNKTIYKNVIEKEKIIKLYEFAEKNNLGMMMNSLKKAYCNSNVIDKEKYNVEKIKKEEIVQKQITQVVMKVKHQDEITKTKDIVNEQGLKIFYFSKKFSINEKVDCSIDIINEDVSKGTGINNLLKKLNIKKEETVCIGDYKNDIDMYNSCGYKVAMGNACREIKNRADYITLSNDEDGVAYFLDKFI